MTDSTRGTGVPHGPPWSVDVLADLHAGALDAKQAAALWAQVDNDPEARAVLAALDGVRHDLDALGDAPAEPMPAHFAAQLDAALAAEAARSRPARPGVAPVAPVTSMAEARRKRNRRAGWAAGVLTAAAAAAAITFVALPGEQETGSPVAEGSTAQEAPGDVPPLALKGDDLGPAISGLSGQKDYGALEDEQGLADCLGTLGIDDAQVIGAREVTLDGTEGIAALLTPGEEGHRFRLVIVAPDCEGDLITDTSLG